MFQILIYKVHKYEVWLPESGTNGYIDYARMDRTVRNDKTQIYDWTNFSFFVENGCFKMLLLCGSA